MVATLKGARKLLGNQLVETGAVTREQLWEALRVQSRSGGFLGETLIKLGMTSEEVINKVLGVQEIRLDKLDPTLLNTIPEQLIRRHKVIPLKKEGKYLTVAMVDPMDVMAIDDLRLLTGCDIEPVQAVEKDILAAIQKHFGLPEVDKIFEEFELLAGQQESEVVALEEEVVDEAPVVRLVNSIFLQAIEQDASDIHIEPQEHLVRVRYRIDGMLREVMTLPKKIQSAVVSRVKIMSDMDISEKRIPQDGRIRLKIKTREIDLRVSSMPTVYGEKVVSRLLDKGSIKSYKIEKIGFGALNLQRFTSAMKSSYGMILITGPTGSGKTTTLYTALNEINTYEKNIITVEDPIEYMLDGINQTQVNVKAGMTFAAGLRSILRQDPDIIMVGEIRDGETAEIAVRAAITGHLVLSTLHTNDAAGAITRLVDMGIEPFLVASSVLVTIAQRLVRLICQKCRQAYELAPDAPERAFIGVGPEQPVTLYRGAGCNSCGNVGYKGRLAVHEVIPVTTGLRPLIIRNAPTDEIKRKALEEGMISLKMDGIQKALEGLTTIEEVMRVACTDET
ncbi:MAG: Type II secretion system protein E [Pelotomaculum sp. PtaB.Bin104]|nr:MAG: Type II secretion system protein E [Pelotomaculum sp. PtaB.Bin104]